MGLLRYVDRRGSGSVKWDGAKKYFGRGNVLPLWVADMDFASPACVADAIAQSASRDVYGYFFPPKDYFDAFIEWEERRHGWRVEREWIIPGTGVVASIYQLIGTLTQPRDRVIVQTPVYYPFMDAVRDTGRTLLTSPLLCDRGSYSIDFSDFESRVRDGRPKLFILCSPHNPVGRVWRRDELERLTDICRKYGVIIISDEIHHDILASGVSHIPAATAGGYSDMVITLTSASKTFNLAGLKNSFVIIENPDLRRRFEAFCKTHGAPQPGYLDYVAVRAAYRGGEAWLEELTGVVAQNYSILKNALSPFPDAVLSPLEGTYLAWLDLGAYVAADKLESFVLERCSLAPDWGSWFLPDDNAPDTHVRLNLATSSENIKTAADSLARELGT